MWLLPVLALASAAPPADVARESPTAAVIEEKFTPVADHHIHLYSPADVELGTPPALPEIKLPADLARVLRQRTERRTDQKALADLYTPDALYLRGGTVGWARGAAAVAGYVRWTISDWPYKIVPVAYNGDRTSARIAGYYMEGKNFESRFGTSLLSLVRDRSGQWRIAAETYVFEQPEFRKPKTAADAVAAMDSMGTRAGVVLSNAYYYDSVRPEPVPNPYPKVRAENDWTAEQVARFPKRLIAFCSFNPLKDYALTELRRCAESGKFRGIKLHFNAAQLNFHDPQEVAKVRAVIATANEYRLPMIIHVRPGNVWGADEAKIFLHELVTAAPTVPIQVAHLWGGESYSAAALKVFANAVSSGDPATRNLYFDVSGLVFYADKPADLQEIVIRMREIGISRLLYGSDNPPAEAWDRFRKNVPLTAAEFRTISSNVAPYLHRP